MHERGLGNEPSKRGKLYAELSPNYLYDLGPLTFLSGSSFAICKMRVMKYSVSSDHFLTVFISYLMGNAFLLAFYS